MKSVIKALQYIWLTVAIAGIVIGIYMTASKGIQEGSYFFVVTLIGAMMYIVNRRRYKNFIDRK